MTNKTTMPEPVAWVRRHPDGALTAEFLEDEVIDPVRKQSGAWLPMITTDQAEAYADARVRAALEEAAQAVYMSQSKVEAESRVRGLINNQRLHSSQR